MVQALKEFDLGLSDVQIEQVERLGNDGQPEVMYLPFGLHQNVEGGFSLPFLEESNGTQSAFVVLEKVLQVLVYGGMAVIDELDNDLHPHLIPKILDWFRFEHTNPHQAQLLFTCHTPEVLNRLQKHQVYLCEKQQHCSTAWRLDAVVGLRADDNLYAKYMAGALGAVPAV
jgi:AAA15 family ATPase/GTPase